MVKERTPSEMRTWVEVSSVLSRSAPSGTVSWSASSVPPGGGSFSASSCTLGGASTDPVTGAVSSSCSVSYTPAAGLDPTHSRSYNADITHQNNTGSVVVTPLNHVTRLVVSCSPETVFFFNDTATTEIYTLSLPDALPISSGTVSWSASSVPPGGGSFSASSCTLGGASTDPVTGAVSSSCSVSYTPAVVGAHTISGSYSGDSTHLRSEGRRVGKERRSRWRPD